MTAGGCGRGSRRAPTSTRRHLFLGAARGARASVLLEQIPGATLDVLDRSRAARGTPVSYADTPRCTTPRAAFRGRHVGSRTAPAAPSGAALTSVARRAQRHPASRRHTLVSPIGRTPRARRNGRRIRPKPRAREVGGISSDGCGAPGRPSRRAHSVGGKLADHREPQFGRTAPRAK